MNERWNDEPALGSRRVLILLSITFEASIDLEEHLIRSETPVSQDSSSSGRGSICVQI